MNILDDENM